MVRGVSSDLFAGEDANQNGLLDPEEDDGDNSYPPDNRDGILDAGLLVRYETFIRPQEKQWSDWLAGQGKKITQGLDLADIREYAFGDDVRHIDWNVTARLDAPYVREFLEDREITAQFLLDLSPSVDFGTADRRKRDVPRAADTGREHLRRQVERLEDLHDVAHDLHAVLARIIEAADERRDVGGPGLSREQRLVR